MLSRETGDVFIEGKHRIDAQDIANLKAQILSSGLTLGAMYAVSTIGLALVYGSLNMLNMAHGALLALGGAVALVGADGQMIQVSRSGASQPLAPSINVAGKSSSLAGAVVDGNALIVAGELGVYSVPLR